MDPVTVLVVTFVVFLLIGVPVAVSIGLAAVLSMLVANFPASYLVQTAYSAVDEFTIIAVPMFILAGVLMEKGGLTERLINFARGIVGSAPGGLATVTIVACTFFAAISGSGPATTAAIGSIMIPAMLRDGYGRDFSAAISSSAGGMGVVIPPSIPMIIYGITAETSISGLFLAGVMPGLMLGIALWMVSVVISKRNEWVSHSNMSRSARGIGAAAWDAKWELFAPVIILGGILGGIFTPTEAAAVAVGYATFIGLFVLKSLKLQDLPQVLTKAAMTSSVVLLLVGAAMAFKTVVSLSHAPETLAAFILSLSENPLILLFLINILLFIVGMFLDAGPAIIILGPILGPIFISMGVDPVHFAIIMSVNLTVGLATPPMGLVLFVASSVSGERVDSIARAIIPFLLVEIFVIFLITYIPAISMTIPRLTGFVN